MAEFLSIKVVFRKDKQTRRRYLPESFLPGRIPQLQSYRSILQVHSLRQEVDSDCRLIGIVERVVHKSEQVLNIHSQEKGIPGDKRGLSNTLLSQKHEFELSKRISKVCRRHFQFFSE